MQYLVSRDWRHVGSHCGLHSHYPVGDWIRRSIVPRKQDSILQQSLGIMRLVKCKNEGMNCYNQSATYPFCIAAEEGS